MHTLIHAVIEAGGILVAAVVGAVLLVLVMMVGLRAFVRGRVSADRQSVSLREPRQHRE